MKFYKLGSKNSAIISLDEVEEISIVPELVNVSGVAYETVWSLRITFKTGVIQRYSYDFKSNADADIEAIMMDASGIYDNDTEDDF